MKKLTTLSAIAAIGAASVGYAMAGAPNGALSDYEKTGEMVSCLPLTTVKDSDPIDDGAILFETNNGEVYLSELRGTCIGLARNKRFSYKTTQNQICKGDIITVANPVGQPLGSCSLGEFEALSKIAN